MLKRIEDLHRVDLNLLVLFEAVLEERHVGRAAERMHVTPSAVSHGLGRLRRMLNDPLFLRTPKGVVPTARAADLAAPVADVLARARSVIGTAAPFDPATSTRRFTIGAPDGASAVLLPPLVAELARAAPGVDVGVRQLLPVPGETSPEQAWRDALAELEARAVDVAVLPAPDVPARFHRRPLYDEDFVVAMRAPPGRPLTLDRYCALQHAVVSLHGDPHGFVDEALAKHGRSRRVAVTVPNFLFALAVVADTGLVAAVPRRFAAMHAPRFGVVYGESPVALRRFRIDAIVPESAMADAGVAWLVDALERTAASAPGRRRRGSVRASAASRRRR